MSTYGMIRFGLVWLIPLVVAATTTSAYAATPAQRADARALLAPVRAFNEAMLRQAGAVFAAGRATETTNAPCLSQANAQIDAAVAAGTLEASDADSARQLVAGLSGIDLGSSIMRPLAPALARADRSWRTMRIRDPVLRAGARGKARQVGAQRQIAGIPDIDFCGVVGELAAAGFTRAAVFAALTRLDVPFAALGRLEPSAAVTRAGRRLRQLGVSRARARAWVEFPG